MKVNRIILGALAASALGAGVCDAAVFEAVRVEAPIVSAGAMAPQAAGAQALTASPSLGAINALSASPVAPSLAPTPLAAASAAPIAAGASAIPARAAAPAVGDLPPGGVAAGPVADAAVQPYAGMAQNQTPVASYRQATWNEQQLIEDSRQRGVAASQLAASLDQEFRSQGGQIYVDSNQNADYHAAAFRDVYGRPTIVLTPDAVNNGSWAFVSALIAGKQTAFNSWYSNVPASAERLAIETAHMAMTFADVTNGNLHSWSTNLDHNHNNQGTYYVWAWYEQMFHAVRDSAGFINGTFFAWLRDYSSKQLSTDPAYQYSLYERFTGNHWRPGTALHGTPIPANVARLSPTQNAAAEQRVYGANGDGDNESNQNLLGYIRSWFTRRGNS